jgi:hypothetical protein
MVVAVEALGNHLQSCPRWASTLLLVAFVIVAIFFAVVITERLGQRGCNGAGLGSHAQLRRGVCAAVVVRLLLLFVVVVVGG